MINASTTGASACCGLTLRIVQVSQIDWWFSSETAETCIYIYALPNTVNGILWQGLKLLLIIDKTIHIYFGAKLVISNTETFQRYVGSQYVKLNESNELHFVMK